MKVKYLKCEPWIELSGGSRITRDAVRRLNEGKVTHEVLGRILCVKDLIDRGVLFPEVILVGESINGELIIIEGHVRITAFLMSGLETELAAIVGSSKNISEWEFY
jgi:hypothetical protein